MNDSYIRLELYHVCAVETFYMLKVEWNFVWILSSGNHWDSAIPLAWAAMYNHFNFIKNFDDQALEEAFVTFWCPS